MRYEGYPQLNWYYDIPTQRILFVKIKERMSEPEILISIPRDDYEDLKEWMIEHDPHGTFKTDRKEDLKLIHRLLDIQEKMIK